MAILEHRTEGAVTHLTMNTPETLNALSNAMIAELHRAFDDLAENEATRVIVLSGKGKAFCAGHNLKEMTAARQAEDGGAAAWADLFDSCAAMMQRIQSLPQPVIAQVHGIATAAGCQLVASCDLAVAAEGTRFGVNGVNIGLFCSTPMVALSRNIPRKKVFEMLTTGDFIEANEAADWGLINKAVPTEDLEAETRALADKLARKLGSAVKIGKEAFYQQIEMPLAAAYNYTGQVMVENMLNQDTEEGIAAFIEKRKPEWDR